MCVVRVCHVRISVCACVVYVYVSEFVHVCVMWDARVHQCVYLYVSVICLSVCVYVCVYDVCVHQCVSVCTCLSASVMYVYISVCTCLCI